MNLQKSINIIEVSPRDGFQSLQHFIETEDKINIIKNIIDAGFKFVEITSIVRPESIPQLSDSAKVIEEIQSYSKEKNVGLIVLAPNKYGALKAQSLGIEWITYVISVSETHNYKNVNRTIEESFRELEQILAAKEEHVKLRVSFATAFGCPYEGEVAPAKVLELSKRAIDMGADHIVLGDTIGAGNPSDIRYVISELKEYLPIENIGVHFHDKDGFGLVNSYAAYLEGIVNFESSLKGLGGCPAGTYLVGNVATEKLINLFENMNVDTSIQREKIVETKNLMNRLLTWQL